MMKLLLLLTSMLVVASCQQKLPEDEASTDAALPTTIVAQNTTATTAEDTVSGLITLPYTNSSTDVTVASCAVSSLSQLTVAQACACASDICTVKVLPAANYIGPIDFNFNLIDSKGKKSNYASVTLTVTSVNDAPVINAISSQNVNAGATIVVPLHVVDPDNFLVCAINLSATSSDTNLVATNQIILGGIIPNCTATITSAAGQSGITNINITATDGLLSSSISFPVNVGNIAVTPVAVPTNLVATDGASSISLTWSASVTGTAPITYDIFRSTTSGVGYTALATCANLSGTTCIDSTAVAATTYYYVVRATNASGTSANSNEDSAALVTGTAPSAATLSGSITQSLRVDFSWTASTGTGPITYTVKRSVVSGIGYVSLGACSNLSVTTCADSTGIAGTTYYYIVVATNASGSTNSNEISARPISSIVITSVAVNDTGGANALVVTWPTSTGSSDYVIKYSTTFGQAANGTTGCTALAPATTCTINSGLVAGTIYNISVIATNSVGVGANVPSLELAGIPLDAVNLSLSAAATSMTPTFSSLGATSYDLSYGTSSGSYTTTLTNRTSGTAITSLSNGTTYYVKAIAKNASGTLSSSESTATPGGVQPSAFSIATATAGDSQVALNWNASTNATSYTVKYGTTSGSYTSIFATGLAATSSTVTGLTNQTTYYFMVIATNVNGSVNATAEFVRTPALPTLSSMSDFATFSSTSSLSLNFNFTLGGLSTLVCATNVSASSSNTTLISNASLIVSGTYPNCVVASTAAASQTGSSTITLTATYGSATATSSFVYKMIQTPKVAYSLRKVILTYAGNAIQVRRLDNSTQNIGFNASGDLDTTALTSFCTTTCSVAKWYDQSGAALDLVQTTTTAQPLITTNTVGGKSSVYYDTEVKWMATNSNVSFSSGTTVNAVAKGVASGLTALGHLFGHNSAGVSSTAGFIGSAYNSAATSWCTGFGTADGTDWSYAGSGTGANFPVTPFIASGVYSPGANPSMAYYENGNIIGTLATALTAGVRSKKIQMAGFVNGGADSLYFYKGYVSEALMFSTNLTLADRKFFENSQGSYFTITVGPN